MGSSISAYSGQIVGHTVKRGSSIFSFIGSFFIADDSIEHWFKITNYRGKYREDEIKSALPIEWEVIYRFLNSIEGLWLICNSIANQKWRGEQ